MELKPTNTIICDIEAGIATLTFNRPKLFNAMNYELIGELDYLLDEINKSPEVRCVILTGNEKAFVAGADINMLLELKHNEGEKFCNLNHQIMDKLENISKPTIAAISGLALGGGCELALACDIRIAAEETKFGFPEMNLGIFPGAGGTQRLARIVGFGWAKHLIMTAQNIDADTAFKIGLVTKLVPVGEVMNEAKNIAEKLAAKAPIATNAVKQCINFAMSADIATGMLFEEKAFGEVIATEDSKEGTKAFLEKRKPAFKGE